MKIKTPPPRIAFLLLIIVLFLVGAYLYAYTAATSQMEAMEPQKEGDEIPEQCPNVLVKDGTELRLYNTRNKEQTPIKFKNLEEYSSYLAKSDNKCPILVLQKEMGAQGDDIYRVVGGESSPLLQQYDGTVIPVLDASRENGYNQGMYPGFDPYGLHVGRITNIDRRHEYTREEGRLSDNPMDPNWGGVEYTQAQIESGKYAENEVTKVIYPNAKAELARALYFGGDVRTPDALNSVNTRPHKDELA